LFDVSSQGATVPVRLRPLDEGDEEWMRLAVEQAMQATSEPGRRSPKVGAVAVRDGMLLGKAHRGQEGHGEGDHAEYCLLQEVAASGESLAGSTVYTTLEPCTARNHPKVPCADRLIEAGVARVFVGQYDPNPGIYRIGARKLMDAGIEVRDFTDELRHELAEANDSFVGLFRHRTGMAGEASFDYEQQDGRFAIHADDDPTVSFQTRWTGRSADGVYAVGPRDGVALARHIRAFDEIDDATALDFDSHSQPVAVGGVVGFRNDHGVALVKVLEVKAGPDRGHDRTELTVAWQLRLRD
jgi:diaminohydroxyphosphoribosylaminopyrimidine deaminase / 5-amino-6-(5-phosphoribosylamino)uracil reductase